MVCDQSTGLLVPADLPDGRGSPHLRNGLRCEYRSAIRYLSDAMAKIWQDHVTNTTEDHIQYPLLDGTRDFTSVQHGVTPTDGDTGTSLITKAYITSEKYSTSILSGDGGWTASGENYYIEITHGLGISLTTPPLVQVWDTGTNKVLNPIDIQNLDDNTIRLDMTTPTDVFIRMQW